MSRGKRKLPIWQVVLTGLGWSAWTSAQTPAEPACLPPVAVESALPAAPTTKGGTGGMACGLSPQRRVDEVEILHGNQRVWPVAPRPATWVLIPVPVVPAAAAGTSTSSGSSRDDKAESRPPVVESRTIILASHAGVLGPLGDHGLSLAPWLAPSWSAASLPSATWPVTPPPGGITPSTGAPSPSPPQVIIVRDREADSRAPAEVPTASPSKTAEAATRGITVGPELLVGLATGLGGLGLGVWSWRRHKGHKPTVGRHPLGYTPLGGEEGVLLMGRYNAGPRPATAEKFDIGPSYATLREEKKKVQIQNQQALVEFILGQNVALHEQLYGPTPEQLPLAEECPEPAPPGCPPAQTPAIKESPGTS
ncbi:MAG: hypothetical protein RMJ88_06360 [Thermogemmata sp.]|nr:hypothetical protein [Thermogemmata sp.]